MDPKIEMFRLLVVAGYFATRGDGGRKESAAADKRSSWDKIKRGKVCRSLSSIIQVMMIHGMNMVGDSMDASGHYGVGCVGAPDDTASSAAFKLGARVAGLCQKIRS
jgi:hypothetical protein